MQISPWLWIRIKNISKLSEIHFTCTHTRNVECAKERNKPPHYSKAWCAKNFYRIPIALTGNMLQTSIGVEGWVVDQWLTFQQQ